MRAAVFAFLLTFGQTREGRTQPPPPIAEVRSILREASALIPMIETYQRVTTAANIAAEQARAGDDEGAQTSRSSAKALDQALSVGGVAYSLAVQGRLAIALDLIAATADGQQKAVAYWQVTQALLKGSKYDDALSVAHLISKDPKEADRFLDTLLQIYVAQSKADDRPGASATLNEALSVVDREPDISPVLTKPMPTEWVYSHRPDMYQKIVHALILAGNRNDALTVAARISAMATQQRDSEKKKGILGALAVAQADLGDFAAALRTAKSVRSGLNGELTLQAIAVEQARQGHLAAALATTAQLTQGVFLLVALQEIARTRVESGDYAGARAAIDRIQDPGERAYGLADLAFHEVDKNAAAAKLTVALAWETAQEAKGKAPSYVYQNAVTFVAATRARLGDFAGALEIINSPDLQDRVWPLANLVQGMTGAGNKDDALALARGQATPRVRADGLLQIARSLMDQIDAANNKTSAPR
jgi:hypothetical protein